MYLEGAIPALSVVDVEEERYKALAAYLLGNVYIADNESVLHNANGFVVIRKSGKYVKGKFSLTRGGVGLTEGKKNRPCKEPGETIRRDCSPGSGYRNPSRRDSGPAQRSNCILTKICGKCHP